MKTWCVRTVVASLLAGAVLLAVGGCADMDLLHVLKARVTGEVLAVHVAPDGTIGGSNRGLDPGQPVGSLARAMEIAKDSGATEVCVAEGQYEITSDDYDDPNGWLRLESEVTIRGGYSADFEDRDVNRYQSRIVVRGWLQSVVGCDSHYGEPSRPVGLDGLLFDIVLRDAVPETADSSSALIELGGASAATVENCTIQVTTGGEFSRGVTALAVDGRSDWDDSSSPAERVIVRNNTILAVSETGEDMTGLSVGFLEPGGGHEVWGNRIMVQGADATGLYLDGAQGVMVANNVISVRGGRDALSGMAVGIDCQRELMSGFVVHNTIVFDSPDSERGMWIHNADSESTCDMEVIGNIVAGYDGDGSEAIGCENDTSHTPYCDYNVCFGVDTEGSGNVDGGTMSSDYSASDLFWDVFGEDWDWDLSDGDEVDYRLHGSSAGTYAIDQGSPGPWAGVDVDIRGVSRPQGGACDRGAYEHE